MGRPVMAIHAVHLPDFALADVVGEPRFPEDSDRSSGISQTDPGDLLTLRVRSDILDPIADRHVPMNAAHGAMVRVATADFEDQAH